ncbi:MAG: hypothetical protein IKR18_07925, partial [Bacteroidaceae bacterium]|nr:hypothetical protein [Bacteroidaceae bacterium]
MEKYVIDVYNTKHLSENRSNATSKPRLDARKIAESLGYRTKLFYEYSCPFWRNDILSKTARKLYWKFENKRILVSELRLLRRKNSILFFQYPFLNKQIEKL